MAGHSATAGPEVNGLCRQWVTGRPPVPAVHRCAPADELESLRQLGGESAARGLFLLFGPLGTPPRLYGLAIRRRGGGRRSVRRDLALGGLRGVGAKQFAFE